MEEKAVHEKGSYLRDVVFAASDGLITTFAVVAGAQGAAFAPIVTVIMGFANLLADGISMSSGTYLGVKSEVDFEKSQGDRHSFEASPFKQAIVTFFAFDIVGFIPIFPYVVKMQNSFSVSVILMVITLFLIGSLRGRFTKKSWFRSGCEMLLIGGLAATVAYLTGDLIEKFTT